MDFKEFLQISEQGTVGGPMGGPGASGRLGQSPVAAEKPVNPNPPPSKMTPGTKFIKPDPSPLAPGTQKIPFPIPQSNLSLGNKPGESPLKGGAFGAGGSKSRMYMKKKMKK